MKDSKDSKFIIDSYGWIEYFSGGRLSDRYAEYIEKCTPDKFITPIIIIYEVYKKIRSHYPEEDAMSAIMHIQSITSVIDMDLDMAVGGADISIEEGLPMADAMIRSTGKKYGAKIITSDNHFRNMDDVIFID